MAGESLNRLNATGPKPLPRRRQIELLKALAREAGWRYLALLSGLSMVSSVLDIAGLGLAISLLLGSGSKPAAVSLIKVFPFSQPRLLVGLILLRGLIQSRVDIHRSDCARASPIDCGNCFIRCLKLHQPSWIDWDAGSCWPS